MVLVKGRWKRLKYIKVQDEKLDIDNIVYTVSGLKILINSEDVSMVQNFFTNNDLSIIELYENDILISTYNYYSEFESLIFESTNNKKIITILLNKIDKVAVQIGVVSDKINVLSEQIEETDLGVLAIESTLEELLLLIANETVTESEWWRVSLFMAKRIMKACDEDGVVAGQEKYKAFFVKTKFYANYREDCNIILYSEGYEDCIVMDA